MAFQRQRLRGVVAHHRGLHLFAADLSLALPDGTPLDAIILPHRGTAASPAQPWLYVRTKRGSHYRVGEAGAIDRYGRRTQRLGSGTITAHGWASCSLRGVRWLQVVADGRLV